MSTLAPYRVAAHNSHSLSVNEIHNDAGAQANGYRSALVPGGTVFAYLCHPVVQAWGRDWLERGAMSVTWRQPTYQEDVLDVRAEADGAGGLNLTARRTGEDAVLARGTASKPPNAGRPAPPTGSDSPIRLAPGQLLRPGTEFRPYDLTISPTDAASYLAEIEESDSPLSAERLVHPAHLQRLASHVLFRAVTFDTSFQVAATADSVHLAAVPWGSAVRVGCRITDEWERRGDRWLATECVVATPDGDPLAVLRRTSIYRLAPRQRGTA